MVFNEDFINTLKDKSIEELDESLVTIQKMEGVIKRVRDFKEALNWVKTHNK